MSALRLLGGLDAIADGVRLRVHRPAALARLLAYLALHRRAPLQRATLAAVLWPDCDDVEGRANLRRHLHLLKSAFDAEPASAGWLLLDAATASLSPDAVAVLDVARFEAACDAGRHDEAIALYGGDVLPDWDDEWAIVAREQVRTTMIAAYDASIASARSAGDLSRAIGLTQRLRSAEPWREETIRTLMGLQFLAGDRAAALRTFDDFGRELRADIGVDPMPQTRQVYDAIRADGASEPYRSGEPAARPPLPFAGRDVELRVLVAALEDAFEGRGTIVLLSGEAGIGKSRLIAEFGAVAESYGARVCAGTTSVVEASPYEAIVGALRSAGPLAAALPLAPIERAALSAPLPEFGSFAPAALDGTADALRLYEAVAHAFAALAETRPLAIVLDDLHFAGSATIAMLEMMARLLAERPVMIVAAHRGESLRAPALRSLHRRLGRDAAVARVALAPLDESAVTSIMTTIRGSAVDERLVRLLAERCAGNPLFLHELLRDADRDDGLEVSRILQLPARVSETILARIEGVSDVDRSMLEVGSVFGLCVGVDLLSVAVGLSEGVVRTRLDVFVDRGVLTTVGPRRAGDYAFSHHLVREAVYDRIREVDRQRIHRRVADVLIAESSHWDQIPISDIAHHLERAGDAGAAAWYLRAARTAKAVHALEDANHYAAAAFGLAIDPRERYDATAIRDDIARFAGDTGARAALLQTLRALADELDDDEVRIDSLARRADAASVSADGEGEAAAIAELAGLGAACSARARYVLGRLQTRRALRLGRYDEAREYAESAGALAASAGATPTEITDLRAMLAEIAALGGDGRDAARLTEEARAYAEASQEPAALLRVLRMTQHVLFTQLRFADSIAAGLEIVTTARRFGDVIAEADAHAKIAPAAARLFRVALAREHFASAAAIYRRIRNDQALAAIAINESVFLMHLGRVDEAAERCDEAEREFRRIGDVRGRTVTALNRSVIEVRRGALDAALAQSRVALRLARGMRNLPLEAHALANLGGVERHRGAAAAAVAHLTAAIALRREVGTDVDLVTDLTEYCLALVAVGDVEAARASCEELRAIVRRTNAEAKDPQFALWSVAQTLRAIGDERGASEALGEALAALEARAAAIPDEASRDAFLRFAMNPEIRRAAASDDFRTVSA